MIQKLIFEWLSPIGDQIIILTLTLNFTMTSDSPCASSQILSFWAGKSTVPLLVVVHAWLQWMTSKITIMQGILHLVLCVLESTQRLGCSAYMYLKCMILSFRQKLHVVTIWCVSVKMIHCAITIQFLIVLHLWYIPSLKSLLKKLLGGCLLPCSV